MNTVNSPDPVEQRMDAALARLPEWRPPQDFAARLAAAAARQVTEQPAPQDTGISILLDQITRLTPATLGSAALAVSVGWIVPWSQLSIGATVWTCVLAMSATGAMLTVRVLRAS